MPHAYIDLPGHGTTLQISISSVFTTINGATDISWDGFKVSERNPTSLTDTHVRKKPGLPNFGSIKCKVWLDPNDTTHILLRDRVTNVTPTTALDSFKLIYADGSTSPAQAVFTGFVADFSQSGITPETGTLEASLEIAIDSVTAFTAGNPIT